MGVIRPAGESANTLKALAAKGSDGYVATRMARFDIRRSDLTAGDFKNSLESELLIIPGESMVRAITLHTNISAASSATVKVVFQARELKPGEPVPAWETTVSTQALQDEFTIGRDSSTTTSSKTFSVAASDSLLFSPMAHPHEVRLVFSDLNAVNNLDRPGATGSEIAIILIDFVNL